MPLCSVCQQEDATISSTLGVLPGKSCQQRRAYQSSPDNLTEFTSDSIKSQRKEYLKSTLQPYRSGELSQEYLQAYGTKNINPTAKEVKRARPVWKDITRGVDVKKSK